jgi:predicted RNA-binding Zn-ribbon protein involved in translation (DUF1610 family)
MLVLMSEARNIRRNLLCSTCGYNLRMLYENASCPECGTAIFVSLEARSFPESLHLHRIGQAAIWDAALNAVTIPLIAIFIAGAELDQAGSSAWITGLIASCAIVAVLHAITAWLATPPMARPRRLIRAPRSRRRLVVRTSATLFAAAAFLALSLRMLDALTGPGFPDFEEFLPAICAVALLSLPVYVFAMGGHYARVCERILLWSLADWHWIASSLLGVCLIALGLALSILFQFTGGLSEDLLMLANLLLWASAMLGLPAYGIVTILLFRTAFEFNKIKPPEPAEVLETSKQWAAGAKTDSRKTHGIS